MWLGGYKCYGVLMYVQDKQNKYTYSLRYKEGLMPKYCRRVGEGQGEAGASCHAGLHEYRG